MFFREIKEATIQGIPRSTIESSIKKSQQSTDVETTLEVRAPGRVGLLVQMQGSNIGNITTVLGGILKKNGGLPEQGIAKMFEKKGIIVISKEESSLEQLEDDAIEFGAEDIEEYDDSFTLTCSPNDFYEVLSKLKEKYEVAYASVDHIPNIYVELTKRDKALFKNLLKVLESHPSVLEVHHNADI